MEFPLIRHINDVLPAIEGRGEFVVGKRDGYQFIDYNYAEADTFDCPIRRECRGLKFDLDGNLIARPFHKFFNLHEKPNEIPESWDGAVVMEKLDGSMVHAAMVNGELVFMTRAGISEQAKMAMAACKRVSYGRALLSFCARAVDQGYTPIFEFTSPNNQIVVRYYEEALTLLAMRQMWTGFYAPHWVCHNVAAQAGFLPCVRAFDRSLSDLNAFVQHTRELKGMEGYVVHVGQQLIKVKADEYVAAHRARSGLLWEKDVLRLVLENKIDDVSALLPEDEAKRLQEWSDAANRRLSEVSLGLHKIVQRFLEDNSSQTSRKEFVDYLTAALNGGEKDSHRSICFKIYDGRNANEVLREYALKQTTSTAKARTFLESLGGIEPWHGTNVDLDG